MPRLLEARRLEGATLEELLDEAAGDRALDAVALYLADIALKRHDTENAITYLKTAEDYHGARGHHARDVRRKLADLLEPSDVGAMRRELLRLVGDAQGKYDVEIAELWLRLKESYDADEWEQAREAMLASLETEQALACIHTEGRMDDLMAAVEKLDEMPRRYERELQERYPDRVLRHYLLHSQNNYDLELKVRTLWDKARVAHTDEEWADIWPGLVTSMGRADMRMAYLEHEGAWEHLMDEAERAGVRALDLYRDQLLEHCPDRVLQAYAKDLRERANLRQSGRLYYRELVERARLVRLLPGGAEVAEGVVAGLRRRYPNRPALLEELDKL